MKEHSVFTLNTKTKYQLIRYIEELEQTINKAIKKLDNISSPDVRNAIKILRCENVRIDSKNNEWKRL